MKGGNAERDPIINIISFECVFGFVHLLSYEHAVCVEGSYKFFKWVYEEF